VGSFRAATSEQASFLDELLGAELLTKTDSPGVYGRSATFEHVRTGFEAAVSRAAADDRDVEVLHFPPLLPKRQLEINGYLGSFPHLAGTVFSFEGSESQAVEQESLAARHDDWSAFQSMTDVVLAPAACYAVYPEIARRGPLPLTGAVIDTGSAWVFRNEPSDDPARMRSFHMREFVRIADPADVAGFRHLWLERTLRLFERLGLDVVSEIANDPFFGRAGRMLAANQRDQELKYEVLAQIGGPEPTAIASFNYHQDHFTLAYDLALEDGRPAHTGCAAFGIERVTLALFRAHGADPNSWPEAVRGELWS
jgi:seryl-tRNA synthetase